MNISDKIIFVFVIISLGVLLTSSSVAESRKIPEPFNKLKEIAISAEPDKGMRSSNLEYYRWQKSIELPNGDIATYRIVHDVTITKGSIGFFIMIKDPIEFRVSGPDIDSPAKTKYKMVVQFSPHLKNTYSLNVYRDGRLIKTDIIQETEAIQKALDFLQEIKSRELLK